MVPKSHIIIAITLMFLVVSDLSADSVVLKSGQQFDGKFISESDDFITFDVRSGGMTIRAKYGKADIAKLIRDVKEGSGYYALPIIGPIGFQDGVESFVSADAFRNAIAKVRQSGAEYVVLEIDTLGGSIVEMNEIVDLISEASDLHFIAYVKQALSAGAVIAMVCQDIYMAPGSTIGAAVAYRITSDGTPANIEEKMQSAIRANFRNVASIGGHSLLLLRGMSEAEIELSLEFVDGTPHVVEGFTENGESLKPSGQILTLTASEAVRCGLSDAIVSSVEAVHSHLGLESWHRVDDQAWHDMMNYGRARVWDHEEDQQTRRKALGVLVKLDHEESRLLAVEADILAANTAMIALQSLKELELDTLRRDYNSLRSRYIEGGYNTSGIFSTYQNQISRTKRQFDYEVRDLRRERDAARFQAKFLRKQVEDLASEARRLTAALQD